MPEISVIVPAYNTALYLDQCIQSILDQDYTDFELILVDDGSTDNTLQKCKQWQKKDSRIIVIEKQNGGQSEARNFGIEKARGRYIAFVDSDDYVTKDYLSYMLSLFSLSGNCSITNCNRQYIKGGTLRQKFNYQSDSGIIMDQRTLYEKALFSQISHGPCSKLYKREVFRDIRFPVGMKHEDTYILGDLINYSKEMVFGNKVCYWYVVHPNSTVHTSNMSRFNDLINATQRLADQAVDFDPELRNAGICKVAHAKLSALSLLKRESKETKEQAKTWKREILENKEIILHEEQNLKRDKIGVMLLTFFGIPGYSAAFKIYEKLFRSV